jgi:HEAT repeat protein
MRVTRVLAAFIILVLFILWRPSATPDLHTEIQQRLLEAEIGSATTFHFASGSRAIVPDSTATDTLLISLNSSSPNARWEAAKELAARRDPRAVEAVIRAMRDPEGTIRVCVMASALGHLKDPRALSALTEAVFDPANRDLRLCAIQSLGMIGDRDAVPTLIEALEARNMPIAAANAIARMGDERGVIPIIGVASDPGLRLWMVMALGELGSPAALAYLESLGHEQRPSIHSAVAEAKWKIAQLSVEDPGVSLSGVLANEHSSSRRMWAAFRLGELKKSAAVSALVQGLDDENRDVRGRSAAALVRIGDAGLPALQQLVMEDSGQAQLYAAAILGYAGGPMDISLLEKVVRKSEDDVLTAVIQRSIKLIQNFSRQEIELSNLATK